MGGRCGRCGAPGSPSGQAASCAACQLPAPIGAAAWLPGAGGELRTILRGYRRASALTQQQLADMLGYDRTYISMIESGRRNVSDRGTLAHIAGTLAIPPHVLGIAGPDDADFAAMLAFGTSVIRLAGIARHSGRAAEAVSELWPLITRLEARVAAGYAEPQAMRLLAEARVSLGVALGHLLPDERLATAARWTGRALRVAWHLGDRPLLGLALRMHGNELRKAGHPGAGIIRLRQALQVEDDPVRQGAGLVLLARAAAESGQADLFDTVTSQCVQALESVSGQDVLFSPFTVREVRLRGLLATGRAGAAFDLAEHYPAGSEPPSPHWRVIERITTAEVLARAGEERTAETMLAAAISDAETLRLPHQVQRIIRLASQPGVLAGRTVHQQALAVFARLDRQLAGAAVQTGSEAGVRSPGSTAARPAKPDTELSGVSAGGSAWPWWRGPAWRGRVVGAGDGLAWCGWAGAGSGSSAPRPASARLPTNSATSSACSCVSAAADTRAGRAPWLGQRRPARADRAFLPGGWRTSRRPEGTPAVASSP